MDMMILKAFQLYIEISLAKLSFIILASSITKKTRIVFSSWYLLPVPAVAARSKSEVFGRSPAEIVGSNPTGGMDVCLL
jgi:hypothetical protein